MKNILIYLLLLVLGYFFGKVVEDHLHTAEPAPSQMVVQRSEPAPPPRRFSTMTEMKLYDYDQQVEGLKKQLREEAETSATLEAMDRITRESLELARSKGTSNQLTGQLQNRVWYLLAAEELEEADLLAKQADQLDDPAFSKFMLANAYRDLHYHGKAAVLLREAIAQENDTFRRYELRLDLASSLVRSNELAQADEALQELELDLGEATQKSQIVRLEWRLWDVRADLADARGDEKARDLARERSREYFQAYKRLR